MFLKSEVPLYLTASAANPRGKGKLIFPGKSLFLKKGKSSFFKDRFCL